MTSSTLLKLIVSIGLPLAVGGISGFATVSAINDWYVHLNAPSFKPPNWLFGPVWTTLYILMGVSLFLIWNMPNSATRNTALWVFAIQLILNFAWSFLFFYFKTLGWALVEIIAMWIMILTMIVLFYRIKPLAAYLNIPYLLWVSFATILNAAFYKLNP